MKRFLQIMSGCVAFGRNYPAGSLIDLEQLSDREKAGAFILIGSGLARIIERYPVKSEDPTPAASACPSGPSSPSSPSKSANAKKAKK